MSKRVVCINDTFNDLQIELIPNRPSKNNKYTVRKKLLTRNGPAYLLEELKNPHLEDSVWDGTFEPSFSIERFREIESHDDLSTMTIEEILEEDLLVA